MGSDLINKNKIKGSNPVVEFDVDKMIYESRVCS